MRSKQNQLNGGYILLELCLILFIIGTMYSFFSISTSYQEEKILSTFVKQLESDLIYIKLHSSTTGERFEIRFSQTSPSYSIYRTYSKIRTVTYHEKIKIMNKSSNLRIIVGAGLVVEGVDFVVYSGKSSLNITICPKGGYVDVQKQARIHPLRRTDLSCTYHDHTHTVYDRLYLSKDEATINYRRRTNVTGAYN